MDELKEPVKNSELHKNAKNCPEGCYEELEKLKKEYQSQYADIESKHKGFHGREIKIGVSYIFDYTICNAPDSDIFLRQCKALEKNIPDLKKSEILIDIDGSQIAVYFKDGKKVTVHNSYYVGAVYIQSEFDLTTFFPTKERGDK